MARVTCLRVSFWPRPIAYPSGSAHCSLRAARRASDPASTLTRTRLERTLRHARSLLPFSRSSPEDFALSGDRGVSICTRTVSVTAHCGPTRHGPRRSARSLGSGCTLSVSQSTHVCPEVVGCGDILRDTFTLSAFLRVLHQSQRERNLSYVHRNTARTTSESRLSRHGRGRQVARPNKPKAAILSLCLAHRSSAPAL